MGFDIISKFKIFQVLTITEVLKAHSVAKKLSNYEKNNINHIYIIE